MREILLGGNQAECRRPHCTPQHSSVSSSRGGADAAHCERVDEVPTPSGQAVVSLSPSERGPRAPPLSDPTTTLVRQMPVRAAPSPLDSLDYRGVARWLWRGLVDRRLYNRVRPLSFPRPGRHRGHLSPPRVLRTRGIPET